MSTLSRRQFIGAASGAAAALGLAACGGSGSSSSSVSASAGSGSAADGGFTKDPYTIATDTVFAPFEYTDDDGNFVGIDVDLLAAIAEEEGFNYDLQSLGFDAALSAVQSGQADGMIAGMSITDERKEIFDFSDPYYDSYVCAAAVDGSEYTDLDSIKGHKVAVKTGTQSAAWAESLKDEYELELTYFDESSLMYQDTTTGNSVACFEDYPIMAYGITQGNGFKIIATEEEEFATPYGFAVLKGQVPELLSAFNAGLKSLKDSGKYDEIVKKYTEA